LTNTTDGCVIDTIPNFGLVNTTSFVNTSLDPIWQICWIQSGKTIVMLLVEVIYGLSLQQEQHSTHTSLIDYYLFLKAK